MPLEEFLKRIDDVNVENVKDIARKYIFEKVVVYFALFHVMTFFRAECSYFALFFSKRITIFASFAVDCRRCNWKF